MSTRDLFSCQVRSAQSVFLRTIQAAQDRGESQEALETVLDATLSRLDQQWAALKQLAQSGFVEQVPLLLETLMKEWAIKEALELLLRSYGSSVDPTDQGLQNAIEEKLLRQQVLLASELLPLYEQGRQAREMAQLQAVQAMSQGQNQSVQEMAQLLMQVLQSQDARFLGAYQVAREGHEDARASLRIAMHGSQQVLNFASDVQTNVAAMLTSVHDHQSVMVEDVARQVSMRRPLNRLLFFGLFLLFVLGCFGCAFFMAMHL
jgi:hypothetical protein